MARMLESWRRCTPEMQQLAREQIEGLVNDGALNPDVREVLEKALG
jgi:aminopeptidase N